MFYFVSDIVRYLLYSYRAHIVKNKSVVSHRSEYRNLMNKYYSGKQILTRVRMEEAEYQRLGWL